MTAEGQLRGFIAKFAPADQRRIRAVRAAMRRRFPWAHELVYDNYNFFVIGYSPTERPSDAFVSIAARANGLGICFIHGAALPDPKRLLQGSGRQTRFIRVDDPKQLASRDVDALFKAAVKRSGHARAAGRSKLIIRSVSAKQRPRQTGPKAKSR
jgi:sigma54-dependent transcription regulator